VTQVPQHVRHQDVRRTEAVVGEPTPIPQCVLQIAQPPAQGGLHLWAALLRPSLVGVEKIDPGQFGDKRFDTVHGGEEPCHDHRTSSEVVRHEFRRILRDPQNNGPALKHLHRAVAVSGNLTERLQGSVCGR